MSTHLETYEAAHRRAYHWQDPDPDDRCSACSASFGEHFAAPVSTTGRGRYGWNAFYESNVQAQEDSLEHLKGWSEDEPGLLCPGSEAQEQAEALARDLENYPLLDEHLHGELEELEAENAWDNYQRHDIRRAVEEMFQAVHEDDPAAYDLDDLDTILPHYGLDREPDAWLEEVFHEDRMNACQYYEYDSEGQAYYYHEGDEEDLAARIVAAHFPTSPTHHAELAAWRSTLAQTAPLPFPA
jgi:hypothetical protein